MLDGHTKIGIVDKKKPKTKKRGDEDKELGASEGYEKRENSIGQYCLDIDSPILKLIHCPGY